ncbi:hypothetical protein [Prauserella halophila]|uniref:hypothetical protein n=1 Tax=Prauserella halophila TaxID=185641 RepID=UPI0020A34732|nr:hypothetical protein [Prauserella halophila]
MTTPAIRSRAATAFTTVLCGLAVTACGGNAEPAGQPDSSAVPHGHVDGAEEAAEPQLRLVLADADGRGVHVLDLLTEDVTELPGDGRVTGAVTDGRFAFLAGQGRTRVVDSGGWAVAHGDHHHYYRTRAGRVGTLDGTVTGAWSDSEVTALARDDGTTVLLDREKLDAGEVGERETVDGVAVPYEQHLVVAGRDGITVRERDGGQVADLGAACREPEDAAVTNRGVVFGCAGGAVLVDAGDGADGGFVGEEMPYPDGGPRAGAFRQRPGSGTLGAVAGRDGAWSLDTGEGRWTRAESGPAAAVTATGADGPLLVLTRDGVLHAYDAGTGEETATATLLDGDVPDGVTIAADTERAYVNDPAASTVHEIDYHDELRVARTFDVGVTPSRFVETGR